MKYLANDGKVFDDIEDCKKYEKEVAIKKLNNRTYEMPYGEYFSGNKCVVEFFDVQCCTDLEIMKECCYDKVEYLYGFEKSELEEFEHFPFTAVVMRRDRDYAELLSITKREFIDIIEKFLKKIQEV